MRSNVWRAMLLLFLLSACATRSPQPAEVQVPPVRMVQSGYSFLPLNESGWLVESRSDREVNLLRKGYRSELSIIQARLLVLPHFETVQDMALWVRQEQQRDMQELPFVLLKHNAWPLDFKGGDCIRSVMTAEEAGPGSAADQPMLIEVHGLTCPHPRDLQVGVSLVYSHRSYPGREDPLLADNAELLLRSLEFYPF